MNPLFILTRRDAADDRLATEAERAGFVVVRQALLRFEPGADVGRLEEHLAAIAPGTALAWTSRHAADALARALPRDGSALRRTPMYAVGEESAAPVRQAGYAPMVPPESLGASELARFIASRTARDGVRRVIFLHGSRSLPDLPDGLKAAGIDVAFLQLYRTELLAPDFGGVSDAIREGTRVLVAYFSPSGVEAFERLLSRDAIVRLRQHGVVVARGTTTALALESRGYRNVLGFEALGPLTQNPELLLHESPEETR